MTTQRAIIFTVLISGMLSISDSIAATISTLVGENSYGIPSDTIVFKTPNSVRVKDGGITVRKSGARIGWSDCKMTGDGELNFTLKGKSINTGVWKEDTFQVLMPKGTAALYDLNHTFNLGFSKGESIDASLNVVITRMFVSCAQSHDQDFFDFSISNNALLVDGGKYSGQERYYRQYERIEAKKLEAVVKDEINVQLASGETKIENLVESMSPDAKLEYKPEGHIWSSTEVTGSLRRQGGNETSAYRIDTEQNRILITGGDVSGIYKGALSVRITPK